MNSIRNFGDTFNPTNWSGYRAREYDKPEDVFQQLVGDALKGQFPQHAFIAKTSGRDGSIDAWVDGDAGANGHFAGFTFPLIFECKHHDSNLANLRSNIAQGWSTVKKKLTEQAESGWPGNFSPWLGAQGYIYCISARFPSAEARNEFQESLRNFFGDLPAGQRPPLRREQIQVWDWNDLAHWLRASARLSDDWLGIGFDDLEDHGTYRTRIAASGTGFHAYLLEENLNFIAPEVREPFHPQRLFERLTSGENLALVGEGGVGKTRTVFEVAEQAHRSGWRVLHLRATDAATDLRKIAEELLRHPGHTLVTADYIDQFRDFDVRYWQHTLLPVAQQRGIRLALFANARPLAAGQVLRHLSEQRLFSIVDMKPNAAQRERITRQIEAVVCPQAVAILGEYRVRELCGPRPIIAMFIARELEKLAQENRLTSEALPRPGDLTDWILKRLHKDLPPAPISASAWEPAPPATLLFATAAALAASPMAEGELCGVVAASQQAVADTRIPSPHIVATLRKGGWLEQEHAALRTPHDAVADEILRDTLDKHPNSLPMLFAAAGQGRPLGRFAVSLGRLAGMGETAMLDAAAQWLRHEADNISQGLLMAEADAVAYALGAVFDSPLAAAALQTWPQLVSPWLEKHARHPAARHLLYRGLKNLPEQEAQRLRDAAFDWLHGYPLILEADFVLGPLLAWPAAALAGRENELLMLAMSWLHEHPLDLEAEFVLAPLLGWKQSRLGEAKNALLGLAMDWLHAHPFELEADFVLAPLLGWEQQCLNEEGSELLRLAIYWLHEHPLAPEAGYVLPPLLGWKQPRLSEMEVELLKLAMGWLHEHPLELEADFVLAPLLGWEQQRLNEAESGLLRLAINWLHEHPLELKARFVLEPLLGWELQRLGEAESELLKMAMDWLHEHPLAPEAQFVFNPLLGWGPQRLGEAESSLLKLAMSWLHERPLALEARFILDPLLNWELPRLGEAESSLLKLAMNWLHAHPLEPKAGYILPPLLGWEQPRLGEVESDLLRLTMSWLEKFSDTPNADYILNNLLLKPALKPEERDKWSRRALELARERQAQDDVTHLLKTLLQLAGRHASEVPAHEIVVFAGDWLDQHPVHPERLMVLARLLRMTWLPENVWKKTAWAALDCLEAQAASRTDDYALYGLLTRIDGLNKDEIKCWLALCCRWIEQKSGQQDCDQLLTNSMRFFNGGVPLEIGDALDESYKRRFHGKSFDWEWRRTKQRSGV